MNNKHTNNQNRRGPMLEGLIGVATVLLIVLVFSTGVDVYTKIRETRFIGGDIEKNTIAVSETGTVYAKPDLAIVNLSVVSEGSAVNAVMRDNVDKMNYVINSVKTKGFEEKDLKIISFNIYPRYEWQEAKESSYYPEGKRILVGYEMTQTLQVKIRDMEKIGEVIEVSTLAGVNQVGDLQLTIENQDALQAQAREEAIAKAKAKARELASQLGIDLGEIVSFTENSASPVYYGVRTLDAVGGSAPAVPTGENKIEVTVNLSYEIR